ncbi:MAG: hypothetical protein IT373_36220 [Polyangiaceae bacterium]|nr:hypothetical protein [Polyangiaceae bacterium]
MRRTSTARARHGASGRARASALALALLLPGGCSPSQGDLVHAAPHAADSVPTARGKLATPPGPSEARRDPAGAPQPLPPAATTAARASAPDETGTEDEAPPRDALGLHDAAAGAPRDPPGLPPVRGAHPEWQSSTEAPTARMAEAEAARTATVKELFAHAGVAFPAKQALLRIFKREGRVELWASGEARGPLTHVTTYEVCYASGHLGPKRKQGDRQVPEGFYVASYFNPASRYHLSMLVSYPNASDKILGDPVDPGNEIMVHGRCVSIGCVSLSDERVEELWVATKPVADAGGKLHIHIFPSRDIPALIAEGVRPEHHAFWKNLDEGKARFERERVVFGVAVEPSGRYVFR